MFGYSKKSNVIKINVGKSSNGRKLEAIVTGRV
jgi:hypothetical protein